MAGEDSQLTVPAKVSAAMLVLAIFPRWSYGYQNLLRMVVCLSAAYIALYAKRKLKSDRLLWIMVFLALLYNPVAPVYLDGGFQSLLHLAAAVVFWLAATNTKRLQ